MNSSARGRLAAAVVLGAVVGSVAAGVVLAATPSNKEKIALTAAGQAHAKAEVLRHGDLGAAWSGGSKKPNLSSAMPCKSYQPKQSDLVLIGAAETSWKTQESQIESEAQVLRTAAMVSRDWRRTVLAPQVLPCLRQGFAKALGSKANLVSFRRVAFPHVATYTRAFRAIAAVTTQIGPVRVEIDFLAMGGGRNELTLTLTGPAAVKASMRGAETRLARILAGRLRP